MRKTVWALVLLFVAFWSLPAMAEILEPMTVPDGLPAEQSNELNGRRQVLLAQFKALSKRTEAFNEKYKDVEEGSPLYYEALKEQAALETDKASYVAAVERFDQDVDVALKAPRRPSSKPPAVPAGRTLCWEDGSAERKAWSEELRKDIADNLSALEAAKDKDDFIPDYDSLLPEQRCEAWAVLFSEIAKRESAYDIKATNLTDPGGSFGLFQIGYNAASNPKNLYGQYAKAHGYPPLAKLMDKEHEGLYNGKTNIKCAVLMFAALVEKHGRIAGGPNVEGKYVDGADAYWSTLRGKSRRDIQRAVREALAR